MGFVRRVITTALDMANLAKHNANFADIETDLTEHNARITGAQTDITAHKASGQAHASDAVTYSGAVVAADNVKEALDSLKVELSQAVISGDSGPEAAAARASGPSGVTYPVLKDRLDAEQAGYIAQLAESVKIHLSELPPDTYDDNTYWYEDMGETSNPDLDAKLVIANAGIDGSQPIQFELIPEEEN